MSLVDVFTRFMKSRGWKMSKTVRELVGEMYQLERMIVSSVFDPQKYIGWTPEMLRAKCENELEMIHVQLKAGRRWGVMGKHAIHGLLHAARVAPGVEAVSEIQVALQNAIVSCNEEDREQRRCDVGLLFLDFVRSGSPITDDLVDKLYWILGNSFDDLDDGEGVQA